MERLHKYKQIKKKIVLPESSSSLEESPCLSSRADLSITSAFSSKPDSTLCFFTNSNASPPLASSDESEKEFFVCH